VYGRSPDQEQLLTCEVCGASARSVTCVPSLVGGEVVGSVLVEYDGALGRDDADQLRTSVAEAAPAVSNLRTLAIAELRAATDGLTGLPNNRSVHETLKRMVAEAGRRISPLAAVVLDLDHFKQVNDTFGHDRGDEVVAAVGAALSDTVRESDFAGRQGGEEFIVLLPDTGREGALIAAEKLRETISGIEVPGVPRAITASLGVAVFPDEARDATQLLRTADRALYTAKANGRNRVETAVERLDVRA
ncbi:MAG: hypothetical protein QOI98_1135, partial [Solirubrobacteraceae bacterium]|nr:hypothetical protein [Solirubrobacteraceae bacterium]